MIILMFVLFCFVSLIFGVKIGWKASMELNTKWVGDLQGCVESRLSDHNLTDDQIKEFIDKVGEDWLDITTNPEKYDKDESQPQ